ncbi:MAG TPA: hypothetical protein VF756_17545, partial [Thermoanaerobaculia bacterium]
PGVETKVPMDDLIEIGVFATAEDGALGEPLYLRMHRVRSGEQSITVTVPGKPARAGIDPRNLLIDVEATDNLRVCSGCDFDGSPLERLSGEVEKDPRGDRARGPAGRTGTYLLAASRSRSMSRMGGCPNSLLYSRLNCEASS